jgi:hypothetical protein
MGHVGKESVTPDRSFITVQVDKGNRENDWELRDWDIQVCSDREKSTVSNGYDGCMTLDDFVIFCLS